ncbi:MAG: ABC-2 transporter permease, partial [Clostridiales bacterium]|nr:ABC-2 transporter permease [Clostridiales bacterium]
SASLPYYSIAIISLIPITVFAYSETYKWNIYENILPVTRKQAAAEKYLLTLILILPALIIQTVLFIVLRTIALNEAAYFISNSLVAALAIPIIMLPIIYKFGYLKGRIVNMIVIAIIMASLTMLNGVLSTKGVIPGSEFSPNKSAFVIAAAGIALFIISMLISIKIYEKKEF